MDELSAQYDPRAVEPAIYQAWLDADAFHATPDARPRDRRFSLVIPPPNVTGALHLGHALNATVQDILIRFHRMSGDNTMWMPGVDHAGIATQAVVEKTIFQEEHKSRHDLGREELVRRIWAWKEKFGDRILTQLRGTGASCDWPRARFTLDPICAGAVFEAFYRMFRDNLIFRGKRLVNWDTHLRTAVADDEVYHETVRGEMTEIRYPVESAAAGDPEFLVVATTRPETMLGDTAVAVHPDDPRYQRLIGRNVVVPLVGRAIPVIADGMLVDPEFGTGVVKVTPAHDPNDYATGQRHKLPMINLLTPDGRVNELGKGRFRGIDYSYVGMKFAPEARKRVVADLEALGLVVNRKPHEHQVGHSDRSKTPIEPYLSDQWFVRMGDVDGGIELAVGGRKSGLAQAAMDAVTDGAVEIVPARLARGYLDWLGQKRDWCISRQLWWGHRIPVWSRTAAAGDTMDARISALVMAERASIANVVSEGTTLQHICLRDPNDAAAREVVEALGFVQDADVLDTWFSSALWPLSTLGWPNAGTSDEPGDQLLDYFYPTNVLSTAREILTLWVARMVMFGLYCRGDVPFRQVYLHPVIQDGEGRPMKKSLGNGVDPLDIVESHGADALRFTLASMATETQDIRLPVEKDVRTGRNTTTRFDLGRNFANKIWNASRFILTNCDAHATVPDCPPDVSEAADLWILSRLNGAINAARDAIGKFRFADYATGAYQFFWTDFCDWYLEIAKQRIRQRDKQAQSVLLYCASQSLRLLHPVMPFVTESIWQRLPGKPTGLLALAAFPVDHAALASPELESRFALVREVTRAVRDVRNNHRVDSKTVLEVSVQAASDHAAETLRQGADTIAFLTNSRLTLGLAGGQKPPNAAAVVLPDAQVYVANVIDREVERKKLDKRREELQKFIASGKTRLSNEAFVSKAPAQVVENMRAQLDKQEEELRAVERLSTELAV